MRGSNLRGVDQLVIEIMACLSQILLARQSTLGDERIIGDRFHDFFGLLLGLGVLKRRFAVVLDLDVALEALLAWVWQGR